MKRFGMPCYCIPGNHDVGSIPKKTSLNYFRKTIGKDYYSFRKNGYSFIGVNTQLWKDAVEDESQKHETWFKKTLKRERKKKNKIIVFGHIPLFLSDPAEKEEYSNLSQ